MTDLWPIVPLSILTSLTVMARIFLQWGKDNETFLRWQRAAGLFIGSLCFGISVGMGFSLSPRLAPMKEIAAMIAGWAAQEAIVQYLAGAQYAMSHPRMVLWWLLRGLGFKKPRKP